MDNVLQVKDAIKEDRCAFGTVDSWLLWVFDSIIVKLFYFIFFYIFVIIFQELSRR